jgi:lysine/ornithine N-monooxygenase
MPSDYPDFPSRRQMAEYYRLYTDTFNLRPNIEFNTKVVMCRPLEDESWEVEFASGDKRVFKGVVVCNGHHWDRRYPSYPGNFSGEMMHSKDYRDCSQLAGKRVLVIGGGNSACDVVSEAARVAAEAHLSLRRGYWFLPKTLFGKPSAESPAIYLPLFLQRLMLRTMIRIVIGKYADYGLPYPDHKIFEHHPTVSSEVLHYLKHGRIKPHGDIERFDGNKVHFVDGGSTEVDTIVCATGFYVSFPFLPEGMVPVKNGNIAQLYAGSVLPDKKNLYVFGTQQIRYGIGPLITPAARLIAKMILLQEKMELPIGLVLRESGAKLPKTHLVDPIATFRRMTIANWTLPLLLRKERRLRKRFGAPKNAPKLASFDANPDVRVY